VLNLDASNALGANSTGGDVVLAQVLNNNFNHHCGSYSRPCFQTAGIFNGAGPGDAGVVQTSFGNVPRNAFYGPHYSDVDLNLYKDVFKKESVVFQVGAQGYNVLNHVNFGLPGNDASSLNTLGIISTDIGPPTSPYGSSQQASIVSGRILVVQGRLVF
jgi:hypothetical protein